MCPLCESPAIEIRGKLVCPFCRIILETCCEGGRCTYPEKISKPEATQEQTHDAL